MDKNTLFERDIYPKDLTPAIKKAVWDIRVHMRDELSFSDGRIIVQGKQCAHHKEKRADYILYNNPNFPIAVIEAKDNKQPVGSGIVQALDYVEILQVPFALTSHCDSIVFHEKTVEIVQAEEEIDLDGFPSPEHLLKMYLNEIEIEKEFIDQNVSFDTIEDELKKYYIFNLLVQELNERVQYSSAKGKLKILLLKDLCSGFTSLDHLDHSPLIEYRKKRWQACQFRINQIKKMCSDPDITKTDETIVSNLKKEIKSWADSKELLSGVVLACLEKNRMLYILTI